MAWNFVKKLVGKKDEVKNNNVPTENNNAVPTKPVSERSDDELAAELDKMSPKILEQAKTPEQRKMVIGIYRKLLASGIDVNDDKAVKKWMLKHPEILQGGDVVKVETVRREEPKVGRNDICPCGSGKKYKKCCGK